MFCSIYSHYLFNGTAAASSETKANREGILEARPLQGGERVPLAVLSGLPCAGSFLSSEIFLFLGSLGGKKQPRG